MKEKKEHVSKTIQAINVPILKEYLSGEKIKIVYCIPILNNIDNINAINKDFILNVLFKNHLQEDHILILSNA